jgi:hypothetical protein
MIYYKLNIEKGVKRIILETNLGNFGTFQDFEMYMQFKNLGEK